MSDYPFAYPLAPKPRGRLHLAEDQNGPIGLTNSGAPRGTTTPAKRSPERRISSTGIDAIAARLTDRDRAILRSVHQHRFLTVRQIQSLHFAGLAPTSARRTVKRVLARLRDLRVLGALTQRVGGFHGGSEGLIHHVDATGDRILRGRSGRSARRATHDPSARFVNHRLAIADAHVALTEADRARQIELTDSAVEPATWRAFVGVGAARRTLKPDLYAETATTDDFVHAWFIEVDLGTESIPTLLAKCREYEAYRQTGIEQDRHGAFPIVVWSITHPDPAKAERRRQALADDIATDRNLPSALFRIVAPEELLPLIRQGGAI